MHLPKNNLLINKTKNVEVSLSLSCFCSFRRNLFEFHSEILQSSNQVYPRIAHSNQFALHRDNVFVPCFWCELFYY